LRSGISGIDEQDRKIYEIAAFIDFHYMEEIDLVSIFSEYGFSKRSFLRHWGRVFNMPPHQYIINLKINEAIRAMHENVFAPVKEIANVAGFKDQLYFSRVFKKQTGLSPEKYREKHLMSYLRGD